ncbi:MAG: molecular chaperone HtpG [Beijerinckiaceae bacterium]|nr:molecular chaperone HtpG [Beijerinckiaceae bacterium]
MPDAAVENLAFQADVAKLLHLMVHSVYSDRDVFLRELLSNAADACEKLRYEALASPELAPEPFLIQISVDEDAQSIAIEDNGIGMSRQDLTGHLGTIARSGTRAFLERIGDSGNGPDEAGESREKFDLIGQFGIGFYSAFMVASRVDVLTRRAGSGEAWHWASDGRGTFSIEPAAQEDAPAQGTRVILQISGESKCYLEPGRIEQIVREHSSALTVPIMLIEKKGAEPRRLTDGAALWTKPKAAIQENEYIDFYQSISGLFDEPELTIHWHAEGRHDYVVLAFVPGSRPFDLFDPARPGRAKLFVSHVLIKDDAEVVPRWLRFMHLVVDSADIPLNVSREMIQESPVFASIKKAVTNRILQELTKLAESDQEKFARIWENFGSVLKEGLYEDPEKRDALFALARFATSSHPGGGRSLKDYVESLQTNQTAIYYLLGEDLARLTASPQLEGFQARGIEVLLLPDPVDAFWVATAVGYDGKPFKSVTQGDADIKSIALKEEPAGETADAGPPASALATLYALMKQVLGDKVEDVRPSDRLSSSPACLVASGRGPDRRLERLLAESGRLGLTSKPVLEVNPAHPLIRALAGQTGSPNKEKLEDIIWLLFDEARLMEGEQPADAAHFAARLTRVLLNAAGQPAA